MKALMYHYVREFEPSHPNFRFLDFDNFCKQLDYFDKNFGFVSKDEWNSFILTGNMPSKSGKVILTFDDAMNCHYNYVFHELKKRNLWGIFYVPTLPYAKSNILDVHRIHLLCGAFDGQVLLRTLLSLISEDMISYLKHKEFRDEPYRGQSNYEGVAEFKKILNYYINHEFRETLIDELGNLFRYDFDPSKFYIPEAGLREMSSYGMIIGSHTVNHPVMSQLTRPQQADEIKNSFVTLSEIGICNEKTYCHPFGGFISFNSDTVDLLNECDISYSFNVEPREINIHDHVKSKQFLPRFDCNLFEFGKAS